MHQNRASKKMFGMSMAEILTVLTVIGVVSGLLIPTMIDNVSTKAQKTQKLAAVTILSEAFGQMHDIQGAGGGDSSKAAQTFIVSALQKSIKIRAVCSKDNMTDCGMPSSFSPSSSNARINMPKNMSYFYPDSDTVDTDSAAFMMVNGVSAAVYYNPDCIKKTKEWETDTEISVKDYVCANFIYDVNGLQGPNKIGQDIGLATVLYSDVPEVAAPEIASMSNSSDGIDDVCRDLEKAHNPTIEELSSMFVNRNITELNGVTNVLTSGSVVDKALALGVDFADGTIKPAAISGSITTRCIKDSNNR